ncbi:hypothetical protein CF386_08560 [Paraphotobacterium marinum]|uniref:Uncharacterized protein n=1 Tax=Paraphotobacterium marinum TaxID=1755811 RepID=A0A220VG04_9GAMM|nr:hypothetical protein [Paraphotobacterium marinum]ASK79112.1 hypothetical protein CF386_08560 [Paraphotobacterium marinum]
MKKIFIIGSLIGLSIFTTATFGMTKERIIKKRWDGNVHEKIIKVKKCWPHRGYCRIKKRTIYLNRDWPDRVVIREKEW